MSNYNSSSTGASGFQGDNGLGDAGFNQRNTGFQTSGNNFESDRQGLQNNLGTGRTMGSGYDDQGTFSNQAGLGSQGGYGRTGGQTQFESAGMTGGSRAAGLGGGEFGNTGRAGYGQVTGGGIASEAGIPNSGPGTGFTSGARGGQDYGRDEYGSSKNTGFGTTDVKDRARSGEHKSLTEKAKDIYHDLKAGTGDVSSNKHTTSTRTDQSLGRTDENNF